MNGFSNNTKKTSVKIFVNIIALLSFTFSSTHAFAEGLESILAQGMSNGCKADDDACLRRKECSRLKDKYATAKLNYGKACGKTGLKDCTQNVEACAEASSSESFNTLGALATAAGVNSALGGVLTQMGQQQQQNNESGCVAYSNRTYQQYKDEKEKQTTNLEKAEEDLAKLTDDRADAEEDFNKEINDLQEALNKAQEELEKTKLEIADKKRKQMQDFQSSQASAKEELRKKGTEILQLRGKLITSQRDKALKMIAMTDASGSRACKKAVNDAKKDMVTSTSLSSGNMINKAKANKQALIDTYNDCMDAFQQQRVALLESKKQETDELNKAIEDATEDMTAVQDSLNTAQSQLTEMQNDAATEQSNAEQNLVKLMQLTQNKMMAAKQKLQTKLQKIEQSTQAAREKINRANNGLATLGPAPSGSATSTYDEMAPELEAYGNEAEDLKGQMASLGDCELPKSKSKSSRKTERQGQ